MKSKKSIKANLDKKRFMFFQIGLICSLAITLVAFEWMSESVNKKIEVKSDEGFIDEIEIEITTMEDEQQENEPEPDLPDPEIIDVVEDDAIVDEAFLPTDDAINEDSEIIIDEDEEEEVIDSVHVIVDIMPVFSKGDFRSWAYDNLKYPQDAMDIHLEGKVIVSFVIDKKGQLGDINVIRSDSELFSAEVERVLQKSPRWEPGILRGQYAKVKYVFPFKFELSE